MAVDGSTNILNPTLSLDALINGIRWAADQGAEVINLILGGTGSGAARPSLKEAVAYAAGKGALVVMAAGNDGQILTSSFQMYPAVWGKEIDGAIAVGSIDATSGAISSFSNRSPEFVDIMAPGSNGTTGILSTIPTALAGANQPYASSVRVTQSSGATSTSPIHGTSMASPVAAGGAAVMVALLKSRGLTPTPRQTERLFLLGATKNSALSTYAKDGAQLNMQALLAAIDSNTGINSMGTQPRSALSGTVVLSQQPLDHPSVRRIGGIRDRSFYSGQRGGQYSVV